MLVSVFTDGSFRPDTKVGGWGCCAISDRGRCEVGGWFKTGVSGVNASEFMAVANGMHSALTSGVAELGDHFLVSLDNKHVIGVMHGENWKMHDDEVQAREKIYELLEMYGWSIRFTHVKGHESKIGRHWPQHLADRMARTYASVADIEARKSLRGVM